MIDGLRRVRVSGFASLGDVSLEPGKICVLIGSLGAGKSNLLRALQLAGLLRNARLGRFVEDAGGAERVLHGGAAHSPSLRLELEFTQGEQRNHYVAELEPCADSANRQDAEGADAGEASSGGAHSAAPRQALAFREESVAFQRDAESAPRVYSLGRGHLESRLSTAKSSDVTAKTADYWLSQIGYFQLQDLSRSSPLLGDAKLEDNRYLRSNGSNLAACLLRLEQSQDEADQQAWRRIGAFARRVAPSLKALCPRAQPAAPHDRAYLEWLDDRDQILGASQLSDGTLRAIALITALGQPPARLPKILCIDEPELGLDPRAVQHIAELMRIVSRHSQLLIATHSTLLVDHFAESDVVLVERVEGETQVRAARSSAELERWLREYDLDDELDT